jgi:hypothetical protein
MYLDPEALKPHLGRVRALNGTFVEMQISQFLPVMQLVGGPLSHPRIHTAIHPD